LCVDDHPLIRQGLAASLSLVKDMQLTGLAATASEGIALYRSHRPDVALMDLRLPDMSGIDALTVIRGEVPDARVIVMTTYEVDVEIRRALAAGACGYLLKTAPQTKVIEAIRVVHAGRKFIPAHIAVAIAELESEGLSSRELEVLSRMAQGLRNREIGTVLSISEDTVKVHVSHIMGKLGAKDRTHAVAIAIRRGII
jgi:DNA-binding NarL/FixJ family response regulator